ncbi:hypothetical protein [Aureivirga sp. CE67]|uniref:hypothetical protein n=1 Tax=Aureivirga sp. CE67 TaxID=1788983 RepID=UPI0018CB4DA7|nr:hypothetical protein [Aureivirga sp. CE67]
MKNNILLNITLLLLSFFSFSQEYKNNDSSPIIYGEFNFGGAGVIGGNGGFMFGLSTNYQHNKDLFTLRYNHFSEYDFHSNYIDAGLIVLPYAYVDQKSYYNEVGLLYGKRWISKGTSFSLSLGPSLNFQSDKIRPQNGKEYWENNSYVGLGYEANIKFFKGKKRRFRAPYGLIPFGKKTSFGRSLGFKFIGNISKNSYFGIGVNYGFGIHRKYNVESK